MNSGRDVPQAIPPLAPGALARPFPGVHVPVWRHAAWCCVWGQLVVGTYYLLHPTSIQSWSLFWDIPTCLAVPLVFLAWAMVPGRPRPMVFRVARGAAYVTVLAMLPFIGEMMVRQALFMSVLGLFLSPKMDATYRDLRAYRWVVILSVGLPLAIMLGLSVATMVRIALGSERIAAGTPYCIQVEGARGSRYKQVVSLSDLMGDKIETTLDGGASATLKFAYESVLEVHRGEDDIERWAWIPGRGFERLSPSANGNMQALQPPEFTCVPRVSFVRNLPWFGGGAEVR